MNFVFLLFIPTILTQDYHRKGQLLLEDHHAPASFKCKTVAEYPKSRHRLHGILEKFCPEIIGEISSCCETNQKIVPFNTTKLQHCFEEIYSTDNVCSRHFDRYAELYGEHLHPKKPRKKESQVTVTSTSSTVEDQSLVCNVHSLITDEAFFEEIANNCGETLLDEINSCCDENISTDADILQGIAVLKSCFKGATKVMSTIQFSACAETLIMVAATYDIGIESIQQIVPPIR